MHENIVVDCRWNVRRHGGIGRFAEEISRRFPSFKRLDSRRAPFSALDPVALSLQLRALGAKVFFSPGFNSPFRSSARFVFTIHDLIHLRFDDERSLLKTAYYATFVKPAVRKAARVLTVSEFSKREILDWTGVSEESISVVRNAAGPGFSESGVSFEHDEPYFLYVGNRKAHKNLRMLLTAYSRSRVVGHVRLFLTGPASAEISEISRDLGISKRLTFLGFVPEDRMPALYRGAVALVLPSLYEGFGLPVVESMACGTAVVCSNVSALPEIVGDAGILVQPYDVDSISEGLNRVAEDTELRMNLGAKGVIRSRLFNWDKTAADIWRILTEVSHA